MAMPGRSFSAGSQYRYGFNGKEKSDEVTDGNYDFGARMFDARIARFRSIDPAKDLLISSSHYIFALNSPLRTIDADGEFPILINGNTATDHERGSPTYWSKEILNTISSNFNYKLGQSFNGAKFDPGTGGANGSTFSGDFLFVDGNRGIGSAMWPNNRKDAGVAQARTDAAGVWAKLKQSINKEGQITEKIEIISHSRGGSFSNGYVEELKVELDALSTKDKIGFAYDKGLVVDLVVHLAPHQSNYINVKKSKTATVGVSNYTDLLSGDDMTGDAISITRVQEDNSVLAHGNNLYKKALDVIFKAFKKGGKDKLKENLKADFKKADVPGKLAATVN